jgi:hypothetical protein
MEQRKKFFFADFHKITKEFCENQQKNGVMQKPATHRKSDLTVLSFFYAFNKKQKNEKNDESRYRDVTTLSVFSIRYAFMV